MYKEFFTIWNSLAFRSRCSPFTDGHQGYFHQIQCSWNQKGEQRMVNTVNHSGLLSALKKGENHCWHIDHWMHLFPQPPPCNLSQQCGFSVLLLSSMLLHVLSSVPGNSTPGKKNLSKWTKSGDLILIQCIYNVYICLLFNNCITALLICNCVICIKCDLIHQMADKLKLKLSLWCQSGLTMN